MSTLNTLFRYMLKLSLSLTILFVMGCSSTNNFLDFYNDEGLDESEYQKIQPNEDVLVIETSNLEKKLDEYYKKDYVVIGFSHFKGQWCPRSMAIDTAKEKGASVIIVSSIHLEDVEYSYAIPISVPHTTYHQGHISSSSYTSGHISGINGVRGIDYNSTTTGYASFSGTSTYYTTSYITDSYTVGYFEQIAFFLAKRVNEQ